MHRASRRAGVSKTALSAGVIILIVAGAGAYVFLTRSSTPVGSSATSSSTNATGSSPVVGVQSGVDQLMTDFNGRNVNGLTALYASDALVIWSGALGGLQGMYPGTGNIRILYAETVGKATRIDANASDYDESTSSPTQANVTYTIKMIANSTVAGGITATILVSEQWELATAGWRISLENWNYTHYDSTLIDKSLGSATTFPQWGYMLKGGNPNLVSEKSFEWHAAPYVAASVYAFLAGIIVIAFTRFREKGRGRVASKNSPNV
jgi:hypothetical protein